MYEQVLNSSRTMPGAELHNNTITDAYYTTGFNGMLRVQSTITPNR